MVGIQRVRPDFAATNIITGEDRTDRVVLEANPDHNSGRAARLAKIVFRNDMTPGEALDAVCDREGEVDIVTELSPADVERVQSSEHAELVTIDANRVLLGIFNTYAEHSAPLDDRRVREAINWAVDRHSVASEALGGYAEPLAALTPPWVGATFEGAAPRAHDPARARALMDEAGWPEGRPLVIATPEPLEGIARLVASDLEDAVGIATEVVVVPEDDLVAGSLTLVEKKIVPPWDMLIHAWFDLSSDLPPAVMHREFFGNDGGFRAGPLDLEFDRRFEAMVACTKPEDARAAAAEIDRYCFEESKALFLCAPHALYAVNKHVGFKAYRTTFELADTEVGERHWSRRNGA